MSEAMDGFDAGDIFEEHEDEVCKCEWQDEYVRQQLKSARKILNDLMVEYDDDWYCDNCKGSV